MLDDGMDDTLDLVEYYKELVLKYEALDEEIDTFLAKYGGHTENMSAEDLRVYREMFHRRSEMLNEMRLMEQRLLDDDDNSQ